MNIKIKKNPLHSRDIKLNFHGITRTITFGNTELIRLEATKKHMFSQTSIDEMRSFNE